MSRKREREDEEVTKQREPWRLFIMNAMIDFDALMPESKRGGAKFKRLRALYEKNLTSSVEAITTGLIREANLHAEVKQLREQSSDHALSSVAAVFS
jgi:hypothetical protein